MDSRLLLSNNLYKLLFEKLKGQSLLREKEVQIHLAHILYHHFGIKRVFNESPYRYRFSSKKGNYFSDVNKERCEEIPRKNPPICDIRLLDPPVWIELKLNSKIRGMENDIRKLFDNYNEYMFQKDEKRYSINILTKPNIDLKSRAQNFLGKIKQSCDVKCKLIEMSPNEAVVIFYN